MRKEGEDSLFPEYYSCVGDGNKLHSSSGGIKYIDSVTSKDNKEKVSSPALHPLFTRTLVTVAELSVEKGYEPLNWLNPDNKVTVIKLLDAAQRHMDLVRMGYDVNDKEVKLDGTPCKTKPTHSAQVSYNTLMVDMILKDPELAAKLDDRIFKNGKLK